MKLDIGCGTKKREGYDGIDIIDFGQKYIQDARNDLPFNDASVDGICLDNFVEHLTNDEAIKLLNECWRILKEEAEIYIIVPHALLNGGSYILQHKSYWTEQTFTDFSHARCWTTYGIRCWKITQLIVNSNNDIHVKMVKSEGI